MALHLCNALLDKSLNQFDFKIPLTQDTSKINAVVDSMEANYSTALYDAMSESLNEIKHADGIKILIALTDGQDNSSKLSWRQVTQKATIEKIPTYIVGFSNANVDTLSLMANSTKGKFFFAQSSNSLDTIYAEISQQIQAFYNVVYQSSNFSSADSTRQIELFFDIDSLYLKSDTLSADFPIEVIKFIEAKERKKQYTLYGGVLTALLISIGVILFFYQKSKQSKSKPIINKLFPNPSNGVIHLNYTSGSGKLQIIDIHGQVTKIINIDGVTSQFDLSGLPNGNYIALIQSDGQVSNSVTFILQQ